MAETVTMKWEGVRALLKEPGVLADLAGRADRVASSAGDGFEPDSQVGKNRARASVRAVTFAARRAQATGNVLLRALDAAKG